MSWYVGYDSNSVLTIIGDSPSLPNAVGVTAIPVAYSGVALPAWSPPNFRLVKWNPSTLQFDDLSPAGTDQTKVQTDYIHWTGEHRNYWS